MFHSLIPFTWCACTPSSTQGQGHTSYMLICNALANLISATHTLLLLPNQWQTIRFLVRQFILTDCRSPTNDSRLSGLPPEGHKSYDINKHLLPMLRVVDIGRIGL
uniref:Putative secreted protein n=1 Tax=Anopheles marajoara TaxID=58244 RepID=A0A2M4C889_9DIPT